AKKEPHLHPASAGRREAGVRWRATRARGTVLEGDMLLAPSERRRIKAVSHALNQLPAGASAAGIFHAIRPCIPWSAGLFSIIRPSAPDALVSHAVDVPPDVFESWLGTPRDQRARALAPLIKSRAGCLWSDSETIKGAQRERFNVLRKLDEANLG